MQRALLQKNDDWDEVVLCTIPQNHNNRTFFADKKHYWRCPHCEQGVIPKLGMLKVWHFAHRPNSQYCITQNEPDYNPETLEHIAMKRELMTWAKTHYPHSIVSIEHQLKAIGRIADVYVDEEEYQLAIECQWSPISIDDLKRRTESYLEAGIEVLWVLGESYRNSSATQWLKQQQMKYMIARVSVSYESFAANET
jgi:competence CoiA-like predicted nuclease